MHTESMSYLEEYKCYLDLGFENQCSNNFRRNDRYDFIASHTTYLWDYLSESEQRAAQKYSDNLYEIYRVKYKKVSIPQDDPRSKEVYLV